MVIPLSATGSEDVSASLPVEIIIADGFDEIFGDVNYSEVNSINAIDNTANISYDISINESDPLKGYVSAYVSLTINGKLCTSNASGEVEAIELTDDKYWQGCLTGNLSVGTDAYENICMYFTKLDSKEEIRITLSISTEHGSTAITFGDLLLDEQTNLEVLNSINYSNSQGYGNVPNQVDIYQPIPNSNFYIVNNAFSSFTFDDFRYYGQRARACYDQIQKRLAVSLKTYANDLNNYYLSSRSDLSNAICITGISHANIDLSRPSYNDPTYIVNIQNPNLSSNLFETPLRIYDVFYDALNALGVPTNTIEQVLSNLYGSFTEMLYSDYCFIGIESANNDYFNFDVDSGMPIIYQLNSPYNAYGTYVYSTSVSYKTLYIYTVFDSTTQTNKYVSTVFYTDQPAITNNATFYY